MNARLEGAAQPQASARSTSAIRERWWLAVLAAVIVGALTFGVSVLLTPRYNATAQLSYSQNDAQLTSQALSSAGTPSNAHNVSNDALILQTSAFAERVSRSLKDSLRAEELRSLVTVASDRAADLIEVTAAGSDPLLVADVANAYATEFVNLRQEESQAALLKAQELLKERIAAMTEPDASSAYGISLKQRYDDLAVLLSLGLNDYELIQEATIPESASFPYRNLLLGVVAGLILGLILLLLLNRLDRRVKDQATLEKVMDLPVIATLPPPFVGKGKPRGALSPVGFSDGNEALLESMRMLRANLKVLGFGETKRSMLVSSVGPGEGKSTLAVNLALSMALSGDRVVLVDADLRNPKIHQYLGIANAEGLGDLLVKPDAVWSSVVKAVELSHFVSPDLIAARQGNGREAPVNKFLCLTSGTVVGDPVELLESPALADLLDDIQGISDYVIVDSPPMNIASDSLTLARSVDAMVFASMLGRDTDSEMLEVRHLLARAEITPLGLVICGSRR